MKNFTKLMFALAMLVVGATSVSAKTLAVDLSALPATSENTTWDAATNTFAWSVTSYNSTELFGSGNYSAYTTLNIVSTAGTADHFRIILKFTNGTGQVTINPVSAGTTSITLTDYTSAENLAFIQTIRLSGANDVTGDITVSSIYLEGPDINYIEASEIYSAPAGTTDIKDLTGYTNNDVWKNSITYPKELAVQGAAFGNGDGSNESEHVDIDGYDYIAFYVPEAAENSVALRVWIWDGSKVVTLYPYPIAQYAAAETNFETEYRIGGAGTYVAKISGYKYLKGVKAANNWGAPAVTVCMAWVGKGTPQAYQPTGMYKLIGETPGSVSLTTALANASATGFDATGVTGTGVDLSAVANPNALFVAGAGVLSNTQNVIVSGVCDNLVLTDGHPFKAPADFTATAASYTTTVNSTAKAGTVCLPFAAAIPTGVEAYTLTYSNGSTATATEITTGTIPANTPVLLNGSGEATFTGSGAVSASATNVSGALTGVFAATTVPTGSYVLQNGTSGLGFYQVASDITANPFRAYLTAAVDAPSLEFIGFDFSAANAETTGVSGVAADVANHNVVFNLNGQRVSKATKGLYIVNGKKVLVK